MSSEIKSSKAERKEARRKEILAIKALPKKERRAARLKLKAQRKKLTPEQKKAKAERRKKYMYVFMNGKQVRVERPQTIEGMDVDDFIRENADPIWLKQNEMWEYLDDYYN